MARSKSAFPHPVRRELEPRHGRKWLRRAGLALALLVLAVAGLGVWAYARLAASLPQLDGRRAIPGLQAEVRIERDALGVPTIRGASRLDAARALGFLHAQERFFQMDLLRRQAAGELAELLGPALVKADRGHRLHRFRAVAERIYGRFSPADRALVDAYTAGVNAGLAALGAPPFEYLALRAAPAPWRPADSVLIPFAMFFELQDPQDRQESALGLMTDLLPPPLVDFLAPQGGEWDAPLAGGPLPAPPIPGPEVFDLRKQPRAAAALGPPPPGDEDREPAVAGSNNWAVAGARTADGRALLANDMHLGLRIPNTWYRASLVWPADDGGSPRRVTGVTLPGAPLIVVGSNGHVAWGFTNTQGDWADLVIVEVDRRRPDLYRTPGGLRPFERTTERIRVRGGKDDLLEIVSTIWGPVLDHDHLGRPRALAWTPHFEEAVDEGVLGLESARNVDEALAAANRSGVPAQNFVVADEHGRIAWTVIGKLPRRVGFDGRVPTSWADGSRRWDGWLAPAEVPRVVDPPLGRVWSANARVVSGDALRLIGDGGYDEGARGKQIRDDLLALDRATARDLLAVQLDDRALFLARWRGLLLAALPPPALAGHPARAELRRLVESTWSGRASPESAAYRIVRTFRLALKDGVFAPLTAACKAADERFDPSFIPHAEGPLWRLVTERPPHLLDPRYRSWDEQLLAAVDATIARLREDGPELARRTWGERNTVAIRHPLSLAVPFLGRFLDLPPLELPGDHHMPRVQTPGFGASERLVVSPGHEEEGFFHMPAGQSGHPLSPHYRDGNPAWAKGEPTPFLPGPTVDVLILVPGGR
ncbi:MAG TPA: penicillin acylase family protein [Thermoanaerobaculia bacterium]|nr:penicillin acylase family protein [Thermoanaerobaculia bacterium]